MGRWRWMRVKHAADNATLIRPTLAERAGISLRHTQFSNKSKVEANGSFADLVAYRGTLVLDVIDSCHHYYSLTYRPC